MKRTIQDIAYHIVWAILYLISLLPWRVLYCLSDVVSPILHRYYRPQLVHTQLTESFPDKDEAEIHNIERNFYRHLCDLVVEIIKQCSMSRTEMMVHLTFSGHEEMMAQCNAEQPLMLVMMGHMANWEWVASLQYWLPKVHCTQVYHPLYNHVFERVFLRLRQQYGGETIAMRHTVRRLLTLHAESKVTVCGMIADQQPKWEAIHHFGTLLNHDSAVFVGSEQIAKKVDCPVYYASMTQIKRGYYHCHFTPIILQPKTQPDFAITDRYLQMLEEDIRESPELWLWTHKRWSRTPEQWEEKKKAQH
ncbi:MAG: lysophospholipid acyltransferase family protein [Bacteroidaceae bacterium]|nr:lysophospholipid acyltransferase family protein [Bacteroidaceae bacterium]MBR1379891.1 lysophospholipid acyltransferase family protein [Bacteroidaceae bacterium]